MMLRHLKIYLLLAIIITCWGERILIGSISDFGHLGPLLNLAEVLSESHEVTIASSEDAEKIVLERNLLFISTGKRINDSFMGESGYSFSNIKRSIDLFFLPTSLLFYDSFHKILKSYDPNLVVCDALTFGCTLAAKDFNIKILRNSPGILMDAINDPIDIAPATLLSDLSNANLMQNLYYSFYNLVFTAYCQSNLITQLSLNRFEKQGIFQGLMTIKDMWSSDIHLVNSAPAFEIPRLFASNTVFTGPLQKPFPTAENSIDPTILENEFIFVSFGTVFSPTKNFALNLFGALEYLHKSRGYRVIYQYNKNSQHKFPSRPWLLEIPWIDYGHILSQSNLKFFVSHGGNGVIQSLQKGKSVIAFPLGADQPAFCTRLLRTRAGMVLSAEANASTIYEAFIQLINSNMSSNAEDISHLFPTNWERTVPVYINNLLQGLNLLESPNYIPWQTVTIAVLLGSLLCKKIIGKILYQFID